MNAQEFYDLSLKLGREYLLDIGFQFKGGNWHLINEDYQLSFILGNDKYSSNFNVKYLTVALRHVGFNWEDAKPIKPLSDIDKASPIQISPFKLKIYCESNYSDNTWVYTNAFQKPRHENVYFPIYYGGKESKGLLKTILGKKEKQARSAKSIETFGAKLISEKETLKLMEKAFDSVSKFGVKWANLMTPSTTLDQLEKYNNDWWFEKEWIRSYQSNLNNSSLD